MGWLSLEPIQSPFDLKTVTVKYRCISLTLLQVLVYRPIRLVLLSFVPGAPPYSHSLMMPKIRRLAPA